MKQEEEETFILMAPCGDAIEVWESIPQLTLWCDDCSEFQVYIPE